MTSYELRDLEEARLFLLQGLWWQRTVYPSAASVRPALEWAMEISRSGRPLPPIGFIADVGQVAINTEWDARHQRTTAIPHLPVNLLSAYEDSVLGKIYDNDRTFARASDALRRYRGRDLNRGVAYLIEHLADHIRLPGVQFAPGVIKFALESPPDEVLVQGFESLRKDGPLPLLIDLYEIIINRARSAAEVLGQEDVFELESGTALAEFGERLALRQVLQAATTFEASLPRHKLRPLAQRMEVPTRILDEDTYPVGGFTSISNRGSVESLLHSQLAYMEPDPEARPDLFDIKFLRDELLYYSRDENQFLRRRRTFVFVFHEDLVATQFKDADLPFQRGILLLGVVLVVINKMIEWLSTDALSFQLVFVGGEEDPALKKEKELLALLFAEQIANHTVHILHCPKSKVEARCEDWAKRSMCHVLNVALDPPHLDPAYTVVTNVAPAGPCPAVGNVHEPLAQVPGDDALASWHNLVKTILQLWI
jgi:hypothetical protein